MTSYSSFSDVELVKKFSTDVDAFSEIIVRYELPLMRYIQRISKFTQEEREDVLQEVFLKAWKNLNEYDESLKFSSWIYRIAHNETISQFRKFQSRGGEQRADWDEDLLTLIPGKMDVSRELESKMTTEKVREILEELPEKYRNILFLKFLEEKSYDEISDILQMPGGTVATNINRAKRAFLDLVKKKEIDFE